MYCDQKKKNCTVGSDIIILLQNAGENVAYYDQHMTHTIEHRTKLFLDFGFTVTVLVRSVAWVKVVSADSVCSGSC